MGRGATGWDNGELGPGGGADLVHLALKRAVGVGVHRDVHRLPQLHLADPGFLDVGADPHVLRVVHNGDRLPGPHALAGIGNRLADEAGHRAVDNRFVQPQARQGEFGLGLFDLGAEVLHHRRLRHVALALRHRQGLQHL